MTDQTTYEAARVIHGCDEIDGCHHPVCLRYARSLADAGMLTDPRYSRFLEAVAKVTPCTCSAQRERAEKAEAEAVYLEADYDERGYKLWRLAAKAGHEPSESDNDADAELSIATALAERDAALATLQRVRELHQPHQHSVFDCAVVFKGDCAYTDRCRICREDYPCPTIRALDDPQEQP